jgi:hypothetical protein
MSQMGLNLPGGARRRGPEMDVYTGLLAFAVVALAVASVFVFLQGSKLGKDGSALAVQEAGQLSFGK